MTITRQERLFSELKIALDVTNQDDLRAWGTRSAAELPTIAMRRIKNLGKLLSNIASFTGSELLSAIRAIGEGRLGQHIGNRSAAAIDGGIEFKKRIENTVLAFTSSLSGLPDIML